MMITSKIINMIWITSRSNTFSKSNRPNMIRGEGDEEEGSMVWESSGGGYKSWVSSRRMKE